MLNIKVLLLVFTLLLLSESSNASPTVNEFTRCKGQAVAILEYCLKNDGDNCWAESRAGYDSCRKGVIKSHTVHRDRALKEKLLKERARREKLMKDKERKAQD